MSRNLKAVWLTLAAVLALSALSTSASATTRPFHSETAHTIVSGSQVGSDVITVNAGTVKCQTATYSGTQSATTETTITLAATFGNCTAFGFVNAPVDMNNCHFTLHSHLTTGDGTTHAPWADVDCPLNPIVVTAFNCHLTIGSQTNLRTVSYTSEGSGTARDVKATWNLTGIKYTQHSKSFPGCTNGTFTNGTYVGAATLKGSNTAGGQVGIWST